LFICCQFIKNKDDFTKQKPVTTAVEQSLQGAMPQRGWSLDKTSEICYSKAARYNLGEEQKT